MESSKPIDDQAAAWLVRRDSGNWSDADQAELDRWLDASTLNVVSFVRLDTAWQRMGKLKSLGAGVPAGVVPSPDDWQLSPVFAAGAESHDDRGLAKWRAPMYVVAASVVVTVLLGLGVFLWPSSLPSYRTPVGGLASVPMTDGSKITLNTDSEIRVTVTATERRVQLEQGEAYFEVARDPGRPFVVDTGDRQVVAVGTAFSVRRERDDIRVIVTEGKVRVQQTSPPLKTAAGEGDILLPAGSIARSHRDRVLLEQKPVPEVEEALSWRVGYLVFRETPLSEAVSEFNRYNLRKIVIQDPSMDTIRLSGKFQSTQYEAFIRLLEEAFPIRAQRSAERIVLATR